MAISTQTGYSKAIKSLDGGGFVTLQSRLDRGGSLQARKLTNGTVQLYWRYSHQGKTSREPIGTYDASAPPKKLLPTGRGYGIAAALEKCRALATTHSERATTGGLREVKDEQHKQFIARKAMSWIDEHGGDERRCELHANLALTYDNLGRIADALPHHEVGLALAQRLGHHSNQAMCLGNHAANRIIGGHLRDGEALLLRARQVRAQADDASSIDGFGAMLQAICDYQSGRYRAALRALAASEEQLSRFAPGFRNAVLLQLAVCWTQLGQWGRLQQLIADLGDPAQLATGTRVRLVVLSHQMDQGLDRRKRPEALREALGLLKQDNLIDMRHMLQIEIASTMTPQEGLHEIDGVIDMAATLGHQGTLIAGHARGARLAVDAGQAERARQHAHTALELAKRASVVRQYPGELWLHCGIALATIGDTAAAAAVFTQGCDWVLAVARDEVPEEFRDSFLHRNPVNRQLLALAARPRVS